MPPILEAMRAIGDVAIERADLLGSDVDIPDADRAEQQARLWARAGIDGVVFAMCDAGVTLPTVLFAAEAERHGIPAAVLVAREVADFASTAAAFIVDGLCLVTLTAGRLDDDTALEAAGREASRALIAGILPRSTQACGEGRAAAPGGLGHGRAGSTFEAAVRNEHISDGLPVIEPTGARVAAMLGAGGRDPIEVLVERLAPSGADLTVGAVAACAVMAGCQPRHFPFVLAALDAMSAPNYRLPLGAITTHPGAHLLLFSGPLADDAGIASGRGCLGPGNPANLTIGRSVYLSLLNVGRSIPGLGSLCLLGSPAQIACCFADLPGGPLPRLHEELAGPGESIVLAHRCESPHNVVDHISESPESLLTTVASVAATLGGNAAYVPGDVIVILNPEHAEIVARAGWTRADVAAFLWETARNDRRLLEGRGIKAEWPAEWEGWERLPVAPSPARFWTVVAGAPGPQSMVAIPWGNSAACWSRIRPAPVGAVN